MGLQLIPSMTGLSCAIKYIIQISISSALHIFMAVSHYKEFNLKTRKNEAIADCNVFIANFSDDRNQWGKLLYQGELLHQWVGLLHYWFPLRIIG